MDVMVLVYLSHRVLYRVVEFFRHWYVKGFRIYWNFIVHALHAFDQVFAWKITLKHVFEPLYKDYSAVGYALGIPFRIGRIILGSIVYVLFLFAAGIVYLLWLLIPPYILIRIIMG
tara:strand:+ start:109 stop:456 length:348 start_codon:yes stop_codon:yes gene_type:complete